MSGTGSMEANIQVINLEIHLGLKISIFLWSTWLTHGLHVIE